MSFSSRAPDVSPHARVVSALPAIVITIGSATGGGGLSAHAPEVRDAPLEPAVGAPARAHFLPRAEAIQRGEREAGDPACLDQPDELLQCHLDLPEKPAARRRSQLHTGSTTGRE
jgi:hypothetical protein